MRNHFSAILDRRLPVAIAGTAALVVVALSTSHVPPAQAADASTPVLLGTTDQFAVLAGAGITNVGTTSIDGDIGSHPTPSLTIPGVTLEGDSANRSDGEVTQVAKEDLITAYLDAEGSSRPVEDPTELGGRTLVAGVYGNDTELGLTGTVTLAGDSDDVFVFQAGSTLITASDSSVVLTGGVQACNVFWQVGSSATFGTRTSFVGTVMALTSISAQQGATFEGRLLARNGAVTLINNTITQPGCDDGDGDGDGTGGTDGDGDGTGGTDGDGDGTGGTDGDGDGTGGTDGDGDGTGGTDAGDDTGGADGGDAAGDSDGDAAAGGADSDGVTGVNDGGDGTDGSSSVTDGSGGSSSSSTPLPGTGGASLWLLVAGLGTLVAGSALTWSRRTRGMHVR